MNGALNSSPRQSIWYVGISHIVARLPYWIATGVKKYRRQLFTKYPRNDDALCLDDIE